MKKLSIKSAINIRPVVLAAIAQIAGIICCKNELYFLPIIGFVALVIFATAFCKFGDEKRLIAIIIAFFLAIGFFAAYIQKDSFESGEDELEGYMRGHVTIVEKDGYVYLKDVFFGNEYLGNAVLSTSYDVYVGQDIGFWGEAEKRDLFGYYGVSSKMLQYAAKYEITSKSSIAEYDYDLRFDEAFRQFFRKNLFKNMSYDSAALCYGMMFGETSLMDSDSLSVMRICGIAHIFAVSGLHVGVLYSFFNKLFRKNLRYFRLIAVPVVLFGYAYICGNSPSSLRAATMFSVMNAAKSLFKPTDKLNSIAFAAIVVLLVSPLSVYSEGFLLSFVVVLTLTIFGDFFKDLFNIRAQNGILDSVNTSIVANIGSLALLSNFFGYISFISFPLNIVVVPLVSFTYIVTFVTLPLGFLLKINLLQFTDVALRFVDGLCAFFYSLGLVVDVTMPTAAVWLYYALILLLSRYCFLKKRTKAALSIVIITLIAISFS